MRQFVAARYLEGPQFPVLAGGQAESARHQRAQRQRAQDAGRIQGLARARLRLLLGQTFAPCQQDQERREKFPDRAPLDDQSLTGDLLDFGNSLRDGEGRGLAIIGLP